jgi:hypothetical protein
MLFSPFFSYVRLHSSRYYPQYFVFEKVEYKSWLFIYLFVVYLTTLSETQTILLWDKILILFANILAFYNDDDDSDNSNKWFCFIDITQFEFTNEMNHLL